MPRRIGGIRAAAQPTIGAQLIKLTAHGAGRWLSDVIPNRRGRMKPPAGSERDCTTFTLHIDDKIYHCPVSAAALYTLCRDQDPTLSRIDAYLELKSKVRATVAQKLEEGGVPDLLDIADFALR